MLFAEATKTGHVATDVLMTEESPRLVSVWPYTIGDSRYFGLISAGTQYLQSGLGSWVESQTVGVIAQLLGLGAAVVLPDGTVAERFTASSTDGEEPALDHPENLLAISDLVISAAELGFSEIDQRISLFVVGESRDITVRGLRLGTGPESPFLVVAIDA